MTLHWYQMRYTQNIGSGEDNSTSFKANINITVVRGLAAITELILSGLPTDRFA